MTVPTVQRAIVGSNHGPEYKVAIDEKYPVPVPGPTQVLVRLEYTGVCHSDYAVLIGEWGEDYKPAKPMVPGHEGVGRVVQRGTSVGPDEVKLGLKVGVPLVSNPCFSCERCLMPDAEDVLCELTNTSEDRGFYGELRDGTWQQYVVVEKSYLIPVPEECDSRVVGPVLCGGVTAYKGIKKSGLKAGQWLVVPGAGGGLGTMAVQYARQLGLRVIGIDRGEKAELVRSLGAELFIDFLTEDPQKRIMEVTRLGAHGVLVLAPSESVYNSAVNWLREMGTLICVGIPGDHVRLSVSPAVLIEKCLNIRGSFVGTRADIKEALDFVQRGVVAPTVKVFEMDDVRAALHDMHAGILEGRAVLRLQSPATKSEASL